MATTTGVTTMGMIRMVRMKRMPAISRDDHLARLRWKAVAPLGVVVPDVLPAGVYACGKLNGAYTLAERIAHHRLQRRLSMLTGGFALFQRAAVDIIAVGRRVERNVHTADVNTGRVNAHVSRPFWGDREVIHHMQRRVEVAEYHPRAVADAHHIVARRG